MTPYCTSLDENNNTEIMRKINLSFEFVNWWDLALTNTNGPSSPGVHTRQRLENPQEAGVLTRVAKQGWILREWNGCARDEICDWRQ